MDEVGGRSPDQIIRCQPNTAVSFVHRRDHRASSREGCRPVRPLGTSLVMRIIVGDRSTDLEPR
jgi:hypothetical protein